MQIEWVIEGCGHVGYDQGIVYKIGRSILCRRYGVLVPFKVGGAFLDTPSIFKGDGNAKWVGRNAGYGRHGGIVD